MWSSHADVSHFLETNHFVKMLLILHTESTAALYANFSNVLEFNLDPHLDFQGGMPFNIAVTDQYGYHNSRTFKTLPIPQATTS